MTNTASLFNNKRLNIFIGAYGSGKSEVSVNVAHILKTNNKDSNVLIADLDIVNPFYRSADAAKRLLSEDIRVISPSYANSNVDVPALPGEIYSVFDDEKYIGVFDIGGEDMGANVLGSMNKRLTSLDHNLFMVVNALRPFTSDVDQIIVMASELSSAAKLPITGLINNTNLLEQTSTSEVIEGAKIIREAANRMNIPFIGTTVMSELFDIDEFQTKIKDESVQALLGPIIVLNKFIRYTY